jgi:phosphatidylglycerophosphatase A
MTTETSTRAKQRRRPGSAVWLASGLGVGLIPFAPGTFGSLWGLALAYGLSQLPAIAAVPVWCVVCLIGVPICSAAAAELGKKDPGAVVWDEIAALPLTFLFIDLARPLTELAWTLAAGFVLFRLFDVVKPPPANWLERLPRGQGIMADDLAAGAYACLGMHLLVWLGAI